MTGRPLLQACAICMLLISSGSLPSAQARASTPVEMAASALELGQFDEVDRILRDDQSPAAIAVRARALAARGRYDDAQALLTPAAGSAPTSDAALELGLLQRYRGRTADATRTLTRLVDTLTPRTAPDYLRLALASRALGEYQAANDFFRDANRVSPNDAAVNTAWGELFLEKYELIEARKSFELALEANANLPAAILGLARIAAESDRPAAGTLVERALGVNASYVPAHLFAAEMALDDRDRDAAHAAVDKALAVNPDSLEARSLDAAMSFLEDREAEFDEKAAAVLALNPVYGEVYRVAGDHAARNYRFEEAVTLTRRALTIDPDSPKAQADLGMQLLRVGDEAGARVALEKAIEGDGFLSSLVTNNLLKLLDTLDQFVTVQDGNLTLRFAPQEAAVMREQAVPLAREALDTLAKRWEFTPTGTVLVEMFPVHDDFAVRTLGLPGMVGALGVCFGSVVALDSPRARPPGEYNWQSTLWHELAHVITLQMSNNRLPRWLSEGISMWEEKRARPEWGREMDVSFAHAMDQGQVLKLAVLNEGFSDPKLISLAYYEASLAVEHLAETFGEPALRQFVRSFARGLEVDDAVQQAFGQSLDTIQVSFDAKLETTYAATRRALKGPQIPPDATAAVLARLAESNPDSFRVHVLLGQARAAEGDLDGAIQALERAASLLPLATGTDNPNKLIAALAEKQGDTARAIRALQAVLAVDNADVVSARKLATLVVPTGDAAQSEDAYRRVVAVDPFDSSAQSGLGRSALRRNDTSLAVRSFSSALATNPPDRASAHADLAEAYLAGGQVAEAKRETLAALEIAPSFERAQDLLLKLVDASLN